MQEAVAAFFDELQAEAVGGMSTQPDGRPRPRAASLPEPEFEVLGARPVRYAAAPTLVLDLQVVRAERPRRCT